jgi:hypothetical protein
MGDKLARRDFADAMTGLAELALPFAQSREPVPLPPDLLEPEQVSLLGNIARSHKLSIELANDIRSRKHITNDRLAELARVFDAAAQDCRQQIT